MSDNTGIVYPRSRVPQDVLDYVNRVWDIKSLVYDPSKSKDTLIGIQLVLDTLNQINRQEDS